MYPVFVVGYISVLVFLYFLAAYLFIARWTTPTRLRTLAVNISVSLFAFLVLFLVVDLGFFAFGARTDGFSFTLASQTWYQRHWKPINSWGYRDIEYKPEDFVGKKVVLVVGDSFVAGVGIENIKDRFSNILGEELGPDWIVVNVAKDGWNTPDEIAALKAFPVKPEIVILSYFLNDIVDAGERRGLKLSADVTPPSGAIGFFINHSYFVNWIYWRFFGIDREELARNWWTFIDLAYSSPEVWETHRMELQSIVDLSKTWRSHLIIVPFPALRLVSKSSPYIDKVSDFLRNQAIDVVDVRPEIKQLDVNSLTVNSMDSHPSPTLNRLVARGLLRRLSPSRGSSE